MKSHQLTRRHFIERAIVLSAAGAGAGALLVACNSGGGALTCTDVTGLSEADAAGRTALSYVDASPDPAKKCSDCSLFTAAGEGCGGCTVVKGPIHPDGTCAAFAAA